LSLPLKNFNEGVHPKEKGIRGYPSKHRLVNGEEDPEMETEGKRSLRGSTSEKKTRRRRKFWS